jgi:hypothetical protein
MSDETWAVMVRDPWQKDAQAHALTDSKASAQSQARLLRRNGPKGRKVTVTEEKTDGQ